MDLWSSWDAGTRKEAGRRGGGPDVLDSLTSFLAAKTFQTCRITRHHRCLRPSYISLCGVWIRRGRVLIILETVTC